jgi:hypothetical protein
MRGIVVISQKKVLALPDPNMLPVVEDFLAIDRASWPKETNPLHRSPFTFVGSSGKSYLLRVVANDDNTPCRFVPVFKEDNIGLLP